MVQEISLSVLLIVVQHIGDTRVGDEREAALGTLQQQVL